MQPAQALFQIIRHCQPHSLLFCGRPAAEAAEQWHKMAPTTQLQSMKVPPQTDLSAQPPVELTVISDCLEVLSSSEGELLLGQLRNFVSGQIAVYLSSPSKLHFTDFIALGFKRWEPAESKLHGGEIYTYDIASYNHKRQWNSPENWANPENWDKYRW